MEKEGSIQFLACKISHELEGVLGHDEDLIDLSKFCSGNGYHRYQRHTALLYELAFTATPCVSGQCCKVKQRRARLVAGWVTQPLEQGNCAHAGYHQYYSFQRHSGEK